MLISRFSELSLKEYNGGATFLEVNFLEGVFFLEFFKSSIFQLPSLNNLLEDTSCTGFKYSLLNINIINVNNKIKKIIEGIIFFCKVSRVSVVRIFDTCLGVFN